MGAVWEHEGKLYDYESYYDLAADSWTHELTALDGSGALWLAVPDATPDDAPFTPRIDDAVVRARGGALPLVIVQRLLSAAKTAGEIA
jgi:hypothetical protein